MPTVRQFAHRYVEHVRATKKSWAFDEARLKAFAQKHGDRGLDTVIPATVDQHKATRAREVSPRTVNHEWHIAVTLAQRKLSGNQGKSFRMNGAPERT